MKTFVTKKVIVQRLINAINLEVKCPSLPLIANASHKKVAHTTIANVAFEVEQFIKDIAGEDLAKGFVSKCLR